MRVGDKVKIPDIGPLATVLQPGKHMVKLELDGEQFWIGAELLQNIEPEAFRLPILVCLSRNLQDKKMK